MSIFAQYVAVIMLHLSKGRRGEALSGSFAGLAGTVSELTDSRVTPDDVANALEILSDFGGAIELNSPLTGGYWKINYDNFRYYFIETSSDAGDNQEEYASIRQRVTSRFPILVTYAESGDDFAKDTISYLKQTGESVWSHLREDPENPMTEEGFRLSIPASDRIVRLDHNQVKALDERTTALIDEVQATNQIEGPPGYRELLLGRLRAGRELIRAGILNVAILGLTLVTSLQALIKKYENELIGALASALLAELVKQIGAL